MILVVLLLILFSRIVFIPVKVKWWSMNMKKR